MSDFDTRLKETLNRVADTTKVDNRFDEMTTRRRRRLVPRFAVPVVAFAAVIAAVAVPMLLTDTPTRDAASGGPPLGSPPATINRSWLTLEPAEVGVYNSQSLPGAGDRAPLRSETIWCFYQDVRPVETHVAGIGVDDPVTIESLTRTCATRTDVSSESDVAQEAMTVCRGVFEPSEYEKWAAVGETSVVTGTTAAPKPGFPVVLGWKSDCVSEALDSNPKVALTADLDLETLNETRALDAAVVTASIENCLTYDQSGALAEAVVDELGPSYMHIFRSQTPRSPDGCFQPFIDQQWGWVISDIIRGETSTSETATTIPPTSP